MGFEFSILDFIQGIRTPALDTIMCFITKLGNAGILWILLAAVLITIPKTRKSGVIVMVALVFDVILCNGILKNLVGRIRPCDINTAVQLLVPRPTDFSFPSGHINHIECYKEHILALLLNESILFYFRHCSAQN